VKFQQFLKPFVLGAGVIAGNKVSAMVSPNPPTPTGMYLQIGVPLVGGALLAGMTKGVVSQVLSGVAAGGAIGAIRLLAAKGGMIL